MPETQRLSIDHNIYRHFKGGLYKVLTVALHSETQEPMVVYVSLQDGQSWVRPYSHWNEYVEVPQESGNTLRVRRFTKMDS